MCTAFKVYSRVLKESADRNGLQLYANLVIFHFRPKHFESSVSKDIDEFSMQSDESPDHQECL